MIRRVVIVAFAGALVFAACGGDDDADPAPSATTTTAAPSGSGDTQPDDAPSGTAAAETTTTAATADAGSGSAGGDVNIGVVVIDGTTYEFTADIGAIGRCDPDFFGAFWFLGRQVDGTGGLEMLIVPDGTEHGETSKVKVNLKDSEERDWRADADGGEGTPEGASQVDSFEVEGTTVSGAASFVDIYAGDDATATGTFEATCP